MGVTEFTCTVKGENDQCTLSLEGEDLGFIIGRRGIFILYFLFYLRFLPLDVFIYAFGSKNGDFSSN